MPDTPNALPSSTPVSDIGKFRLIEKIAALTAPTESLLPPLQKGVGDDCSVVSSPDGTLQLATTSLFIENLHFELLTTPLDHLGSKIISVAVSNICAMNGTPRSALLSIGLTGKITVEMVEALYRGAAEAATRYGVALIGGDTSASTTGFIVSVTVMGDAMPEKITYRTGAQIGDLVCATGNLGGAFAGIKILMRERREMLETLADVGELAPDYVPDLTDYKASVARHLLPKARLNTVRLLAEHGAVPTSMIDMSAGLATELSLLCKASSVGAVIEENKVPITAETRAIAEEFEDDGINYALFGGGDYELLFTLSPDSYAALSARVDIEALDIKVIGSIQAAETGIRMVDVYGQELNLIETAGVTHFEGEPPSALEIDGEEAFDSDDLDEDDEDDDLDAEDDDDFDGDGAKR